MSEADAAAPGSARYLLYASQPYALAVLRPLQDAIRGAGGDAAWFFDGPGARYLHADERRLGDVRSVKEFDPFAVFVPGNSVADFFPGLKVEVFHGFSVAKRSERAGHFRIRGLFDLYCTQGSTTTPKFRQLAQKYGYFGVEETGWPKVDPLFRNAAQPNPYRAGWEMSAPLVLYASTFTARLSSAPILLDTIRELAASRRWNWLVTLHPKMPANLVRAYRALEGPNLRFVESDDVIPMLRAADAMVSDTSSIVHEFLLLHKPVVTLRNTVPGAHLIDIRGPLDLAGAVERALQRPRELIEAVRVFADLIHPYRDGRSSERVLQVTHDFAEHHGTGLRRKPLCLWRKLQNRHRLGYYRLR